MTPVTLPPLLLIGHFPPPRGGVAAHLERLRATLPANGIAVECYTFSEEDPRRPETVAIKRHRMRFVARLLRGAALMHYHTDERDWKSALALGLWCFVRRQRYLLTVHSFRPHPFLRNAFFRALMRRTLRRAVAVVCISENLQREIEERLPDSRAAFVVTPSFIPPMDEERTRPMPPDVEEFLRHHSPRIAFNAYNAVMYQGGDLYGGDTMLAALARLAGEFPELGVVMIYTRTEDTALWETIRKAAAALGDHVLLLRTDRFDFLPIVARSDISMRATRNDGGPSLTVLEALSLGTFCVASDAVPRPSQAILFRTGDADDLARALRDTLARVQRGERQEPVAFPTALDGLLPIYRKYLSA